MPVYEVADRKYEVDEDGFLQQPEKWNAEVAEDFARSEHIEGLTEKHWQVINYIRDYYLQHDIAPMVHKLCKETACPLTEMYDLFPSGPAKGACKVAGLPKPTGCV